MIPKRCKAGCGQKCSPPRFLSGLSGLAAERAAAQSAVPFDPLGSSSLSSPYPAARARGGDRAQPAIRDQHSAEPGHPARARLSDSPQAHARRRIQRQHLPDPDRPPLGPDHHRGPRHSPWPTTPNGSISTSTTVPPCGFMRANPNQNSVAQQAFGVGSAELVENTFFVNARLAATMVPTNGGFTNVGIGLPTVTNPGFNSGGADPVSARTISPRWSWWPSPLTSCIGSPISEPASSG